MYVKIPYPRPSEAIRRRWSTGSKSLARNWANTYPAKLYATRVDSRRRWKGPYPQRRHDKVGPWLGMAPRRCRILVNNPLLTGHTLCTATQLRVRARSSSHTVAPARVLRRHEHDLIGSHSLFAFILTASAGRRFRNMETMGEMVHDHGYIPGSGHVVTTGNPLSC
jgi:hypothetical protein